MSKQVEIHITEEQVKKRFTRDEIMARGKESWSFMRSVRESIYTDIGPRDLEDSGKPEDVLRRLTETFRKQIDQCVDKLTHIYDMPKDTTPSNVSIEWDGEEFEVTVTCDTVPPSDEEIYKKGIGSFRNQLRQEEVSRRETERKKKAAAKKEVSDLKRLIKKNPELAKKLLTGDDS